MAAEDRVDEALRKNPLVRLESSLVLDAWWVEGIRSSVITVQTIALTDGVTAIQIRGGRMAAGVLLVQALGGGSTAAELPSPGDVTKREEPAPKAP